MAEPHTQPPPPPSHKDIEALRLDIRQRIHDAKQRADTTGKPLLILVGEHHGRADSLVLNLLIYEESRNLGIRDIAIELPPAKTGTDLVRKPSANSRMHVSMTEVMRYAQFHGANLHLVDEWHHMESHEALNIEPRNVMMGSRLGHYASAMTAFVGAMHLQGMEREVAARGTHEVLSFYTHNEDGWQTATSHTLTLPGDASQLDDEERLQLALGSQAVPYIRWAEREGYKLSHAARDKILAHPEAVQTIASLYTYGLALYDAKRDYEAGRVFQWLDRQPPSQDTSAAAAADNAALYKAKNLLFVRHTVGEDLGIAFDAGFDDDDNVSPLLSSPMTPSAASAPAEGQHVPTTGGRQ